MEQKMPIKYNIVKSNRKTISIMIDESGTVMVRAPRRISDEQILALVKEKERWILKKRQEMQARNEKRETRRYCSGERYALYGKEYELEIRTNADARLCRMHEEGERLILEGPLSQGQQVRTLLREWYFHRAREIFADRAAYHAAGMGVRYGTIRIKEQKTRWGSCSEKGNLNFNWKLLLGPPQVLDYVVVHELCHLKHMDHSAAFWNCVRGVLPGFESQRVWLREHGRELEL